VWKVVALVVIGSTLRVALIASFVVAGGTSKQVLGFVFLGVGEFADEPSGGGAAQHDHHASASRHPHLPVLADAPGERVVIETHVLMM